ncbi:MAG: sodium:proton antiporter [Chitinophagaceae bacterium]|nr:MAG: sodium:proton antiporter [Chitinophagaceae bacterium]
MEKYILLLTIIGLVSFAMAWMPAITKKTGISYSIIYVGIGVLLYTLFPSYLPSALPGDNKSLSIHLSELIVIVSLMGTGIKIDRSFTLKNWATPLKLVSVSMLLTIAGAALAGHYFLKLDWPAAVLLGAALAPTDPVLASDVQVGPPNKGAKSETRFGLTAEAGMNDGMAFPFTWLAIALAMDANGSSLNIASWLSYHVGYQIIVGLIMGITFGKLSGFLVFSLPKRFEFFKTSDGFLAISLTLAVYGLTEIVHGYGFIAVFFAAITFRHYEKEHAYHKTLHDVTDQTERLLIAIVLILFGGALVTGILDVLTWPMALFTLLFVFILRPVSVLTALLGTDIHQKEKLAISFFGIRGIGSIFYLAFALNKTNFNQPAELWAIVSFTILVSVLIHGLTAQPVIKHLKSEMPVEKTPD